MNINKIKFDSKKNVARWEQIRSLIATTPMTAPDVAKIMGLQSEYINAFIRYYRLSVHIAAWNQERSPWAPLWLLGEARDTPRPPSPRARYVKVERPPMSERSFGFVKQAVARDWSVEMFFGPAVDLNAELRGMHA